MTKEITYIGYSGKIIELLANHDFFLLKCVITKPGVVNSPLRKILKTKNITLIENDSAELLDVNVKTKLCLVYKYAHIIPSKIIKNNDYYNIHPGSIRNNRGAHPLRWSVLFGDDKTYLSLYRIDGVDEGDLICELPVNISGLNYTEADEQMDCHLNKVLCFFQDFICRGGKCEKVTGGGYRNKISENDYMISLSNDDYSTIQRKIRAVSDFGGAVVMWNKIKLRAIRVLFAEELPKAITKQHCCDYIYLPVNTSEFVILQCSEYRWI